MVATGDSTGGLTPRVLMSEDGTEDGAALDASSCWDQWYGGMAQCRDEYSSARALYSSNYLLPIYMQHNQKQ